MKLLIAVVLLLLFAAAVIATRRGRALDGERLPIFRKSGPLTEMEQVLYWRLVEALPGYAVLAQVGLSRMIQIEKGPLWQTWFNKISRKSVDFVVCRKDMSVAAVFELDDGSHDREDRVRGDADKFVALQKAGYALIRWHVKKMPAVAEIVQTIQKIEQDQK